MSNLLRRHHTRHEDGGLDEITGDINVNELLFPNMKIVEVTTTKLETRNHADVRKHFSCSTLFADQYITNVVNAYFSTSNQANANIVLRARDHDTATLTECAKLLSASEPEFGISRAGDITQLAGKTATLGTTVPIASNSYALGALSPFTIWSYLCTPIIYFAENDYIKYLSDVWYWYIANAEKLRMDTADLTSSVNLVMGTGKTIDCATNSADIKPNRKSQSAEPTPASGAFQIWRDTDDDKTYFIYNDPDVGVRKVELT